MNILYHAVKTYLSCVIILTLLLISSTVMSIDITSSSDQPSTRALDDTFEGGVTFSQGINQFQVVNNLKARKYQQVSSRTENLQDITQQQTGTSVSSHQQQNNFLSNLQPQSPTKPSNLIGQKGDFGLFLTHSAVTNQAQSTNSKLNPSNSNAGEGMPVVHNSFTGTLAIVTGVISFKYKVGYNADQIASEYGYSKTYELVTARLAFMNISNDMNEILHVYNNLKQDQRLERVSIDVIEHFDRPQ